MTQKKLSAALVVQRYGDGVGGGSELHCRLLAEHLAHHVDVEVLTTTAEDYITWENHFPEGEGTVNGITVRRFAVDRPRLLDRFAAIQNEVFDRDHGEARGLQWVEENGPVSSGLIDFVATSGSRYDVILFYTFRYHTSFQGLLSCPTRSILVPTAEDDPAIRLPEVLRVFEAADGILFLTPEERELVASATGIAGKPHAVIGCGAGLPGRIPAQDLNGGRPYVLYVGRIDPNKGCEQLFAYFQRYLDHTWRGVDLLLIGTRAMEIPDHPNIRHLGFVSEEEKYAALQGCELLIMPSFFESLSIVILEAWELARPVLVNGHCAVLKGQSRRANGGLWYDDYTEFRETMEFMLDHPDASRRMGASGRSYVAAEYSWDVIEGRVMSLIERVVGGTAAGSA